MPLLRHSVFTAVPAAKVVEIARTPPNTASCTLTDLFYLHGDLVELCTITSARPLIPKGDPDTKEVVQPRSSTMYSRKEKRDTFGSSVPHLSQNVINP